MNLLTRILICLSLTTVGVCAEKSKKVTKPLPEISIGRPDAPILIIDYSSLTCHHCAKFYLDVIPEIEEKYIKPGYVRVVFRDFPGDQISIKAHQLAWCQGKEKYLEWVKRLYQTQEQWLAGKAPAAALKSDKDPVVMPVVALKSDKDPVAALKSIALRYGVSAEQFEKTLKDQELMDKIIQARLEGQKKYKINATPTLIINARIHPSALTLAEIEDIISPILEPSSEKKEAKKEASQEKKKDTILNGKEKRS